MNSRVRFLLTVALAPLLLLGCAGPQQTAGLADAGAPSKAQVVIVESELAPDDAYRALAQELQNRGYALSHSDATLRSVATEFRDFGSYLVKMNGSVANSDGGSRVRLQGSFKVPAFGIEGAPIEKFGMEGSAPRNAWVEMHSVAEAVGGEITYQ